MSKIKFPKVEENEDLRKLLSYPPELEHNTNRPLVTEVHSPYVFKMEEGITYIVAEWMKEWAQDPKEDILDAAYKKGRKSKFYNPFERFDQDTFLKTIMAIDIHDPDSVLNFYNENGILGTMKEVAQEPSTGLIQKYGINIETAIEEYVYFKKEISLLQYMIKYHEALSSDNLAYIKSWHKIPDTTPDKDVLTYGKYALMSMINSKLDLIQPVVMLSSEGEFYKGTTATSLLGVFYYRLYEILTDNQKLKKCRYCGDYFVPRKSNANFCPPPEANERSKCANRYDAMVRRIAEWHFKEGLTVDEIQQKLSKPKSRSIKEVQYIIDNYTGKLRK